MLINCYRHTTSKLFPDIFLREYGTARSATVLDASYSVTSLTFCYIIPVLFLCPPNSKPSYIYICVLLSSTKWSNEFLKIRTVNYMTKACVSSKKYCSHYRRETQRSSQVGDYSQLRTFFLTCFHSYASICATFKVTMPNRISKICYCSELRGAFTAESHTLGPCKKTNKREKGINSNPLENLLLKFVYRVDDGLRAKQTKRQTVEASSCSPRVMVT